MIIKEENYYEDEEYTRLLHNPYLERRIECACCGKSMNMSDLFLVDTYAIDIGEDTDDLYSPIQEVNPNDYDEAYRNRFIKGLVPVVTKEDDEEGYYYRCFCKSCWNKIWDMRDEDIFNNFEASDYEF